MKFMWPLAKCFEDTSDYELLMADYLDYKPPKKRTNFIKPIIFLCLVGLGAGLYFFDDISAVSQQVYIQVFRGSQEPESGEERAEKKDGYLVWNPSGQIPELPVFHEKIREHIRAESLPKCGPSLSHVERVGADHVLRVDIDQTTDCCYALVMRQDVPRDQTIDLADNLYTVGPCTSFANNVTFSNEEQFVQVRCTKKSEKDNITYSNMHAFIRKTENVIKKIETSPKKKTKNLNVLLVGIESVSRYNVARTMPSTLDYLTQEGWLGFKGYNAIHNKAFPNLAAVLTGETKDQLKGTCWPSPDQPLNSCPFIWNNFSEQGYVTAYAEDEPDISTFNQNITGFAKMPTDYYLRPFMLASEKLMEIEKAHGLNVCLGPTSSADHIMNYALDFVKTFQNDSYFGLFWMNSFSRNNLNTPAAMEWRILHFLKDLKKSGALETTLVVFLSDHGVRIGEIRDSYFGWMEERLPFLYFWVPEYYRTLHPDQFNNLKVNSNDRFVSPFDLYKTLQGVLGLDETSPGCPKCHSLFGDIPWDRSCADAGIEDHWCTCAEYKEIIGDSATITAMTEFALENMNTMLRQGAAQYLKFGTQCAELKLAKLIYVKKGTDQVEYEITFGTAPGNGVFQANIGVAANSFRLLDTVSRVNTYKDQNTCISDPDLHKYCYCIDQYNTDFSDTG